MNTYIDRLVDLNHELKSQREKEATLLYQDQAVKKAVAQRTDAWKNRVAEKVPDTLEDTLKKAFSSAFRMAFQAGSTFIDKTYDTDKLKKEYIKKRVVMQTQGDRFAIKKERQQGKMRHLKNLGFTATEGIGLGALGIGLPDIPILIGNLVRICRVTANSYGIDVQRQNEQIYMLMLIRIILLDNAARAELQKEMDTLSVSIEHGEAIVLDFDKEVEKTANQLAQGMLFSHFIMGLPIVGMAGGLYNTVIVSRLQQLAEVKYDIRLLERCKNNLVQEYHREKGELRL